MLNSYKELTIWKRSIELVKEVYSLTNNFPSEEKYDLISQIRCAAVSIPSNIAEGQRRKDLPEFLQFLRIADASSAELETQLIIGREIFSKINFTKAFDLLDEVQKMLRVLMQKLSLKTKNSKLKTQRAFTLVEMAITATIMIMASSILIVFSQGTGNRITLSTEQAKIAGVLNRAKSLALQRYRTEGGSACGFAFRFNDPPATYAIAPVYRFEDSGECTEVQDDIEVFELNRNVMFENSFSDVVIFESPYLVTKNPTTIEIALRKSPEDTAGVEVTAGGAVVMK